MRLSKLAKNKITRAKKTSKNPSAWSVLFLMNFLLFDKLPDLVGDFFTSFGKKVFIFNVYSCIYF